MDFTFDDEQQAVTELAAKILGDKVTEVRLRELERAGEMIDEDAWQAMLDAGLVSLCLPEADGGSGFGILEACLVAEEVGRRVAPVPYVPAVVAAMAIAHAGTEQQRREHLASLQDGRFAVPAIAEAATAGSDAAVRPTTASATPGAAGGRRLRGEAWFVPWADRAATLLVPAELDGGSIAVLLVDANLPGVGLEALDTTDGASEHHVTFDDVELDDTAVLGGSGVVDGAAVVGWMVDRLTVAVCALQAGVSAEALRLTATYTSQRHQFDVPIATFQAVAQRAADAYIDVQAIRYTMWQAAWRLADGRDAADEIDIAKFWAADGGQRVAHAAQHLHGGIGVDTDYPLHRYFLWTKRLELTAGGATTRLRRLGRRIAEAA